MFYDSIKLVILYIVFIKKPHRIVLSHQYLRDRLTLHSLTLCRKPQIFRLQCFLHCFSLLILVSSLFYLQQFLQIIFYDFKNALLPLLKFIVSVNIFSPSGFSMQKSLNMMFSISILLRIF